MPFPANAPAAWTRVYLRGYWTDIVAEVREETHVGLPGARLDVQLGVSSVTYRDTPDSPPTVVDTTGTFGVAVESTNGEAVLLVPVGDDPQVTPLGGQAGDPILTRVFDPVLGPYDLLLSEDTPVLNRPGDPLHGERVVELGQVSLHAPSGEFYLRVPGPPGPADAHAVQHSVGGSDSLAAHYLALTGNQTVAGTKTFSSPPVVPVGTAPGHPVRRDDAAQSNSRTPTAHAATHEPGGTDPVSGYVPSSGNTTVAGIKTFSSPPVVPVGGVDGNPVRRDDARLGNARTPVAHAASHAPGGTDQLVGLNINQIAGLQAALDSKLAANLPAFRGRQIVAQNVANETRAPITMTSELVDTDNGHSTSTATSRYVAQRTGYYLISATLAFAGNGIGSRLAELQVNGTEVPGASVWLNANSNGATRIPIPATLVYLNVNDYVELIGYQSSGAALATETGFSSLNIMFWRA